MIESKFSQDCLERLKVVTSRAMEEQKSFLLRILENNKDTFFLDSEKNIKRDTLKQGKQTFFDDTYDKHEKS